MPSYPNEIMEEEEAYSLSDDAFGQIALSAYKVGTAIKISEELLNDSVFDLPSYIAKEFARRIGSKEEEAFLVGDGKGKPRYFCCCRRCGKWCNDLYRKHFF